ncbi:MAG: PEGA domain-containing protein [Terriglobales bacterium]
MLSPFSKDWKITMGPRHNPFQLLLTFFFLGAISASVGLCAESLPANAGGQAPTGAASPDYTYRIKVLSVESIPINGGTPVPKNCDLQNFDAYCNQSKDPSRKNTMLVQSNDGKSFKITCTVDSRWSKCVPLPLGDTFDAKKGKNGITVLYKDSKGKDRSQLYKLVDDAQEAKSGTLTAPQPHAEESVQEPTGTVPVPAAPVSTAQTTPLESVKCKFNSAPPGAEITVDGKYMGNTPSVISLGAGTHDIALSLAGFAQWQRQLTITAGSDVDVTATLQKSQP